jgi:hypothetical protein
MNERFEHMADFKELFLRRDINLLAAARGRFPSAGCRDELGARLFQA